VLGKQSVGERGGKKRKTVQPWGNESRGEGIKVSQFPIQEGSPCERTLSAGQHGTHRLWGLIEKRVTYDNEVLRGERPRREPQGEVGDRKERGDTGLSNVGN